MANMTEFAGDGDNDIGSDLDLKKLKKELVLRRRIITARI